MIPKDTIRQSTADLLKKILTLAEPFTSKDVMQFAPASSSVQHHLNRFIERGWLEVVEAGGDWIMRDGKSVLTLRTYRRTDSFPKDAELVVAKKRKPREFKHEGKYWENYDAIRSTINIKPEKTFDDTFPTT